MGTEKVNLAVIIKNRLENDEFLLIKQTPPPKFNEPEYDSYRDSDLWDLPAVQLPLLGSPLSSSSRVQIEAEDNSLLEFLNDFDVDSAIDQVLRLVGSDKISDTKWILSKIVEEPEFGPGIPVKTVYIVGDLEVTDSNFEDHCKWMGKNDCATLFQEVKPQNDRVGPLVVIGLLNDLTQITHLSIPPNLRSQLLERNISKGAMHIGSQWKRPLCIITREYPPGVTLVPMRSRTAKPFHTTNLIVFVPGNSHDGSYRDEYIASGDALIIDPGCSSAMHKELEQIVSALPRKLVVFVTHHHHDHVDGLSIVQKCNPEATLVAHENTFHRIKKDDWTLGYTPVKGSEEICIRGQLLRVISAQGHTDGHVGLLHVATNSLIVGDHCVGQGSAVLDIYAGGNMSDYFHTTYQFMELSPHVLIPMHGRFNMWPKHMLCGYLKNRRYRESTILKAIQNGAKSLFDIVSYTYGDVDRSLWIPASSNVRLHVEHLALQDKLPQEFSMLKFQSTYKLNFFGQWALEYARYTLSLKSHHLQIAKVVAAGAVTAVAVLYSFRSIPSPMCNMK